MRDKHIIFQPNSLYVNIGFESIKASIKNKYSEVIDYGSILAIQDDSYCISVNSIGKVELFINVETEVAMNIVNDIEMLFKQQISSFELVH